MKKPIRVNIPNMKLRAPIYGTSQNFPLFNIKVNRPFLLDRKSALFFTNAATSIGAFIELTIEK
jgi:hypothetical protein